MRFNSLLCRHIWRTRKISEDDCYDWFPYPPRAMLLHKKLREVDLSPRVDFFTTPPTGLIALAVESKKESGQVNVSSIRAEQVSRWNETQKKHKQKVMNPKVGYACWTMLLVHGTIMASQVVAPLTLLATYDCTARPCQHLGRVYLPVRCQPAWTSPARVGKARPNSSNITLFGHSFQLGLVLAELCLVACSQLTPNCQAGMVFSCLDSSPCTRDNTELHIQGIEQIMQQFRK